MPSPTQRFSSKKKAPRFYTGTTGQPQNAPSFIEALDSFFKGFGNNINQALSMLDELLATPMANVNAILDDFGSKFYDILNTCKNATLWHGLVGAGVGVSAFIGFFVSYYQRLRDQEKTSHFFWFKRLLDSRKRNEILKLLNGFESEFDPEILSTAAHFYSPDIKFVSWGRRVFCWGEKRKNLKRLQCRLKEGEKEKVVLTKLFREISKITVFILNENAGAEIFECKNRDSTDKSKKANYSIGLTKNYQEELLNKIENRNGEVNISDPGKEKIRKKSSLGGAVLNAVGEASFIYWLAVFIFCFIPVGIVSGVGGAVAFPPLAIAFGFLFVRLGIIFYQFGKRKLDANNNVLDDSAQKEEEKERWERRLVEIYKREVFIKYNGISSVSFKDSKLHKGLQKVLSKRRFSKFHARLNGFVEGCFLPFFAIWLFSDLLKLLSLLAFGVSPAAPVMIGIAIVTLLLGVGYGIYSARKAADAQEARYKELERKISYLEGQNIQIADLSLQAYDRLLRRYSLEEPLWTRIKKALNRAWVIIKRLGTGSLLFRLVIWATITACVTIPAAWVAPIAIPFIVAFAVGFAVYYYHAYNVESKLKQTEEVVGHLYYKQCLITEEDSLSMASKSVMQVSFPNEIVNDIAKQESPSRNEKPNGGAIKPVRKTDPVQVVVSPGVNIKYTADEAVNTLSPHATGKPMCRDRGSPIEIQADSNIENQCNSGSSVTKNIAHQEESPVYTSHRRIGFWPNPHADFVKFLEPQEEERYNFQSVFKVTGG